MVHAFLRRNIFPNIFVTRTFKTTFHSGNSQIYFLLAENDSKRILIGGTMIGRSP